ncbi:alpha/beta fold hydrolase [Pseudomaricurvus sp. HS19]|uniref:alpha/beta fold hydrolase n=1 Tax=Pseudomaricurvus sp. HS19 TaxID=2692626 RepID=UPI00136F918E|nr:alpha/beta fold hydrolase [Pseudomaricurvus sp. HS19]MYM64179.1 alpha/beta fold hydrolase [Pseudomaricurvus sp. HS19]
MQEVEQRLTLNEVEWHCRQRGENPQLVLLHGFGGDLHTWDALLPLLPDSLSTLRYDMRDFGLSRARHPQHPFSHADDLLSLLDAFEIERCCLLGSSMGGATVLHAALNHPDRVSGLVLISPGMVAWEWSEAWRQLWRPMSEAARSGDLDRARQLWWQHPLFESTRNSTAAQSFYAAVQRFAGRQWVQDPQQYSLPDIERLHTLQAPTLLLSGALDLPDFQLIADVLEAAVPNLQRRNFADAGHMLHLEQPQACAEAVGDFLHTLR